MRRVERRPWAVAAGAEFLGLFLEVAPAKATTRSTRLREPAADVRLCLRARPARGPGRFVIAPIVRPGTWRLAWMPPSRQWEVRLPV
eukprot:scaffold297_cov108-Isochrysis_galbana.AAC.13